ncbi:hypothetical protein [Pontibacter sp. G13]|uniref:tetratricopeptide repeat protein n=1 Tax=Pontibacter sp. G13 TaxID=3074898 RepID=UPI00288BF9AB|nr:hypothetical protein [Pontibacter sp. G13]WNJ17049.1 hypothetical protein RJD25_19515 [Pontibacter sp. G13]
MTLGASAQDMDLLGKWVLEKHFSSVDWLAQRESLNLYSGEFYQEINFFENYTFAWVTECNDSIWGIWKISKGGKKLTIKSYWGIKASYFTPQAQLDYTDGELEIPGEYLVSLYHTLEDTLNGGISFYRKVDAMTIFAEDTSEAYLQHAKGLKLLEIISDEYPKEAMKALKKSNRLRPGYYWENYYWLAVKDRKGKLKALKNINRAIQIEPKNPLLYHAKFWINRNNGKRDDALVDINFAIALAPNDPQYYMNRASLWKDEFGLLEQAQNDLDVALGLDPTLSRAYYDRAHLFLDLGQSDRACEDFKLALEYGYTGWIYHMRDCGLTPNR